MSSQAPMEWEPLWRDAVLAIFKRWEVIYLCIQQEWAGRHSEQQVNTLLTELHTLMLDRRRKPLTLIKAGSGVENDVKEWVRRKQIMNQNQIQNGSNSSSNTNIANSGPLNSNTISIQAAATAKSNTDGSDSLPSLSEYLVRSCMLPTSLDCNDTDVEKLAEFIRVRMYELIQVELEDDADLSVAKKCILLLDTARRGCFDACREEIRLAETGVKTTNVDVHDNTIWDDGTTSEFDGLMNHNDIDDDHDGDSISNQYETSVHDTNFANNMNSMNQTTTLASIAEGESSPIESAEESDPSRTEQQIQHQQNMEDGGFEVVNTRRGNRRR